MIDLGGGKIADGNEAAAAMLKTPGHQAAIAGGLAHFCGLPRIEIDGDTATVTSYLQILTPHPTAEPHEVPNHGVSKGFRIHRVGSNRWDLVRTPSGWKIKRRTLRPLDGSEPARELLRHAVRSYKEMRLAIARQRVRLVRRMLEVAHRIVPGVTRGGRALRRGATGCAEG